MSPLIFPPDDLTGFPEVALSPDQLLVRIHQVNRGPWWFGSSGLGRFDLPAPRGTCYLAEDELGAFVEVFQEPGPFIPMKRVLDRRISTLSVPVTVRLADCTDSRSRRFGLTAEIHSGGDRQRTQAWATAFARAGFDGIRYLVRHDPGQRLTGMAIFGQAGETPWPVVATSDIGSDLIRAVERRFGIIVYPAIDAR